MNTIADIRQEIFDCLDWDPSGSTEAVARVNRLINSALQEIALTHPQAWFETVARVYTAVDEQSASDDDTVAPLLASDFDSDIIDSVSSREYKSNPWVFRTTYGALAATGATTPWNTERAWDGRFVELTDINTGLVYTRQIRTVWLQEVTFTGEIDPGKTPPVAEDDWTEYRFSIVEPWDPDDGAGPFTWRVYQPTVTLPTDVISIKSIIDKNQNLPVNMVEPGDFEDYITYGAPYTYKRGFAPYIAARAAPVSLKGLATKPGVQASESRWIGPEPPGTFDYVVTLAWGKVNREILAPGLAYYDGGVGAVDVSPLALTSRETSRARHRMPRWESAPSPISDEVEVVIEVEEGNPQPPVGVDVILPNFEYALGFLMSADGPTVGTTVYRESVARSGIYAIIYRRRKTEDYTNYTALGTDFAGVSVPTLHKLDILEGFYKLAEVRIDEDNEGKYTDTGAVLPDMLSPLKVAGTHAEIQFTPIPTERTKLEIRYTAAPRRFYDDTDPIPLLPAGRRLVIGKAGQAVAVMVKSAEGLALFQEMERESAAAVTQHANINPQRVTRVKAARAGRTRSNRRG